MDLQLWPQSQTAVITLKVCFIAATKNKACEVCINGTVMLIAVGDYRITVHHWCTSQGPLLTIVP